MSAPESVGGGGHLPFPQGGTRRRLVGAIPRTPICTAEELPGVIEANKGLIAKYVRLHAQCRDPEDFLADAVKHLLENFDQFRDHPLRALVTWMRTQKAPAQREETHPAPERPTPEESLLDQADVLRSMVATLPERDRLIMALDLSGFEPAEIAPRVDLTEPNVRVRKHRLKKKLNASWSASCRAILPSLAVPSAYRLRWAHTYAMRRVIIGLHDNRFAQFAYVGVTAAAIVLGGVTGPAPVTGMAGKRVSSTVPAMGDGRLPVTVARAVETGMGTSVIRMGPHQHAGLSDGRRSEVRMQEDVHLDSMVASPGYATDRTVVAAGSDRACQCWRLLLSTDGGKTWVRGPAPAGGIQQIALPSTYPLDPEIFASDGRQIWRAPRFGGDFAPVGSIDGSMALSALFSTADRDAYVINGEGLWREPLGQGMPLLELAAPSRAQAGAVVTGTGAESEVVVWVYGPSVGLVPNPAATAPSTSAQPGVYGCSSRGVCTYLGTPPLPGQVTLVRSPSAAIDHRIGVMSSDRIALSVDDGHTFTAVALPVDVQSVVSLAVVQEDIWTIVRTIGGDIRVLHMAHGVPQWKDVTAPPVASSGALAALPDGTIVDLLGDHGYWCLRPQGQRWQGECGDQAH